jgi:hypothetical protein
MWHTTFTQVNQGDSWLLLVGSQIGRLTFGLSFGHNLCFKYPNGSCKPVLDIYVPKAFQHYKELFNPMSFNPYNHPLKIQDSIKTLIPKVGAHLQDSGLHRDSNSPNGNSLGNVWIHSLTLPYTLRSMKCDSHTSLLARTFARPYLSRKLKAKVATKLVQLTLLLLLQMGTF